MAPKSQPRSKSRSARRHKRRELPDPVIEAYKRDIDRTLLRENLKLSIEQRVLKLIELQRFAEELKRSGNQR